MPDQNDNLSPTGSPLDTPPAGTDFQPAPALQDAGVDFEPAGTTDGQQGGTGFSLSRQSLKDNAQKLQAEARALPSSA